MNKPQLFVGAFALIAAVAGVAATPIVQGALPAAPASAANAEPAPYAMTLGDMMNTLIQPRHAKLGLAGRAQNWPLAEYALVEIRRAFAAIVKVQPRFQGLPVGELVDAAVKAPMNAVEAAIQNRDAKQFATAYAQLTTGCNACHAAADHPFVVIKGPDVSAFPNQDFQPRQ
jgi:hypothetical protein